MKIKLLLFVLSLISLSTYSQVSSGAFTVGGSSASYYPVSFSVSGVDGNSSLGKLSVYIDNVHANGTWSGSFHSDIEFISSNWGHIPTKIVEFTYVTGGGDAYRDPIGDIADGSTQAGGSQLVIWLKGAATYQWSTTLNSRVTLIDGNPEGTAKTSFSGGALNILTTQSELVAKAKNAKFYPSVGLGTSGNVYFGGDGYFGGKVGIGVTNPSKKLEVATNTSLGEFRLRPADGLYQDYRLDIVAAASDIGAVRMSIKDNVFLKTYGYYNLTGLSLGVAGYEDLLHLKNSGNVGIGTTNPDEKLTVNGVIHAKEVKVDLSGPLADFVFKPNYILMSLPQVEQFVKANNHLPQMPSANEVAKNGLSMGEMQNKLLQKVEELTLYSIEQEKGRKVLEEKLAKQEQQYNALLQKVDVLTKQLDKK